MRGAGADDDEGADLGRGVDLGGGVDPAGRMAAGDGRRRRMEQGADPRPGRVGVAGRHGDAARRQAGGMGGLENDRAGRRLAELVDVARIVEKADLIDGGGVQRGDAGEQARGRGRARARAPGRRRRWPRGSAAARWGRSGRCRPGRSRRPYFGPGPGAAAMVAFGAAAGAAVDRAPPVFSAVGSCPSGGMTTDGSKVLSWAVTWSVMSNSADVERDLLAVQHEVHAAAFGDLADDGNEHAFDLGERDLVGFLDDRGRGRGTPWLHLARRRLILQVAFSALELQLFLVEAARAG